MPGRSHSRTHHSRQADFKGRHSIAPHDGECVGDAGNGSREIGLKDEAKNQKRHRISLLEHTIRDKPTLRDDTPLLPTMGSAWETLGTGREKSVSRMRRKIRSDTGFLPTGFLPRMRRKIRSDTGFLQKSEATPDFSGFLNRCQEIIGVSSDFPRKLELTPIISPEAKNQKRHRISTKIRSDTGFPPRRSLTVDQPAGKCRGCGVRDGCGQRRG